MQLLTKEELREQLLTARNELKQERADLESVSKALLDLIDLAEKCDGVNRISYQNHYNEYID